MHGTRLSVPGSQGQCRDTASGPEGAVSERRAPVVVVMMVHLVHVVVVPHGWHWLRRQGVEVGVVQVVAAPSVVVRTASSTVRASGWVAHHRHFLPVVGGGGGDGRGGGALEDGGVGMVAVGVVWVLVVVGGGVRARVAAAHSILGVTSLVVVAPGTPSHSMTSLLPGLLLVVCYNTEPRHKSKLNLVRLYHLGFLIRLSWGPS